MTAPKLTDEALAELRALLADECVDMHGCEDDVRALIAALDEARAERDRAVWDERAAIVAWLRSESCVWDNGPPTAKVASPARFYSNVADAISRGEHRERGE